MVSSCSDTNCDIFDTGLKYVKHPQSDLNIISNKEAFLSKQNLKVFQV